MFFASITNLKVLKKKEKEKFMWKYSFNTNKNIFNENLKKLIYNIHGESTIEMPRCVIIDSLSRKIKTYKNHKNWYII